MFSHLEISYCITPIKKIGFNWELLNLKYSIINFRIISRSRYVDKMTSWSFRSTQTHYYAHAIINLNYISMHSSLKKLYRYWTWVCWLHVWLVVCIGLGNHLAIMKALFFICAYTTQNTHYTWITCIEWHQQRKVFRMYPVLFYRQYFHISSIKLLRRTPLHNFKTTAFNAHYNR